MANLKLPRSSNLHPKRKGYESTVMPTEEDDAAIYGNSSQYMLQT